MISGSYSSLPLCRPPSDAQFFALLKWLVGTERVQEQANARAQRVVALSLFGKREHACRLR